LTHSGSSGGEVAQKVVHAKQSTAAAQKDSSARDEEVDDRATHFDDSVEE
jgi:hypothetical protein